MVGFICLFHVVKNGLLLCVGFIGEAVVSELEVAAYENMLQGLLKKGTSV